MLLVSWQASAPGAWALNVTTRALVTVADGTKRRPERENRGSTAVERDREPLSGAAFGCRRVARRLGGGRDVQTCARRNRTTWERTYAEERRLLPNSPSRCIHRLGGAIGPMEVIEWTTVECGAKART